jgi:hypothetical protein
VNIQKPVSKSDICWILVKVAGVWLIYTAIAALYASAVTWFSMSDLIEKIPNKQRGSVYAPMKVLIYSAFLPFALGLYLLNSGRTIHRILMSIPIGSRDHDDKNALAGTTLVGDEAEAFKNWLTEHPEMSKRESIDQIALFRDAQRKSTGSGSHSH